MNRIFCPINTPAIDQVVNEYNSKYPKDPIGKNWGYNLVGLFQAKYNTGNIPNVAELHALLNDTNRSEVLTAIPIYNGGSNQLLPTPNTNSPSNTSISQLSTPKFYEGNITPDENTIFVFGSNPEGRHGKGAAKIAMRQFDAQYGIGEGLTGNSYALPTKDLRVKDNNGLRSIPREVIVKNIQKLYETARAMPQKQFKVAYRNTDDTSLNGYTGLEMIEMFKEAGEIPNNIVFSKEWFDTGKFSNVLNIKRDEPKITSISKDGRISLYTIPGEGRLNKLKYFVDFLSGRIPNKRSELQAKALESFYNSKDAKDLGVTNEKQLTDLLNNARNCYSVALWIAQSHLLHNDAAYFDKDIPLSYKNVEMEVRSLSEALRKLKEYKRLRAAKTKENQAPISGTHHIKLSESPILEISKDFSPSEREERIEVISRLFTTVVENQRKAYVEDIKARIENLSKQEENISNIKALKELREDLSSLEGDNGSVATIDKAGGVETVKERVLNNYKAWLEMSDEEAIDREKKSNPYVKNTLKKLRPDDYDTAVLEYIQKKRDIYSKVVKHFDTLFMESYADIEFRTGIVLSTSTRINSDELFDEEGNPIDLADNETGETYKDGYMTKARQIDPIRTLSREVKVALSDIPMVRNGSVVRTELGEVKYLSAPKVYTILLTEVAKLVNDDAFGDKTNPLLFLERLSNKYLWVKQVIKKLKREDGSIDNRLLTKLFTALRLQGVYYSQVREDYWSSVNTMSGTGGVIDNIRNNIKLGIRLNTSSIYNEDSSFNKKNAEKMQELHKETLDVLAEKDSYNDDEVSKACKDLGKILGSLGIEVDHKTLLSMLDEEKFYKELINDVFPNILIILKGKEDMSNGIYDAYKFNYEKIVDKVGVINEGTVLKTSFSNRGIQKQSYSAINKLHKILNSLSQDAYNTRLKDSKYRNLFEKTLHEQYLKDQFFLDSEGNIANYWLRTLRDEKEFRQQLHHVTLDSIDGIPYKDWEEEDIYKAFAIKFLNANEASKSLKLEYALYCMPIFSDSEAAIFIRAPKFTGDRFKEDIIEQLRNVVKQEVFRIKRVKSRGELIRQGKLDAIANYDIVWDGDKVKKPGGSEFKFFPQLNDGSFFGAYINLINEGKTKEADALIDAKLTEILQQGFEEFKNSISYDSRSSFNISKDISAETLMEQFYYNSVLANTQIIQLTTIDLAFYKNAVDFQKRFKELYAAGTRLNTNSEKGKKVRRVLYMRDQIHPSNSISHIKGILDSNPNLNRSARDYIYGKFKKINATDAQALLTPKSFSEMMDMLGDWSEKMQTALDHFRESARTGVPVWTGADFQVIWQTLKPFMYTIKDTNTGLNNNDNIMRTPLQHKNSEFLMAFIFNLVSGGASNNVTQKALTRFMEKHDIDAAMFESAVKVGGHSLINLNYNERRFNSDSNEGIDVYGNTIKTNSHDKYLQKVVELLKEGKINDQQYKEAIHRYDFKTEKEVEEALNDFYVNEGEFNEDRIDSFDYEDVMIAQKNPEHLLDTEASFGSQFANIILSDILGTINVRGTEMPINEARDLYNDLRLENILQGYKKVREEFSDIHKLKDSLINTINRSTSYSRDLANALEIVPALNPMTREIEEVFNLPLITPSISNQLTQLLASAFKNKVTKQKINGGNAVLVSDFGLTDELELEFENGKLKGVQCFLPAYTKEFFKPFIKEDGTLDIDSVPEDLRKIIGYRIPTEGKYSMVPLIIKGFLPQQNGSVIMLPSDITTLSGSDYDIDKMFLMIPSFRKYTYIKRGTFKRYIFNNYPNIKDWGESLVDNSEESGKPISKIDALLDQIEKGTKFEEGTIEKTLADFFEINREIFTKKTIIKRIVYDMNKPAYEQSKEARDNMIIELAWAALTSEEGTRAVLTPGNFDNITHGAKINTIASNKDLINKFYTSVLNGSSTDPIEIAISVAKSLREMSADDIIDFVDKNEQDRWSCSPSTFVGFHSENTIGGKMIGICANSNTHHAKTQNTGLRLSNYSTFSLFGITESRLDLVKSSRGKLISSTLSEYSAASVDDAKEHNLKPLNLNPDTAKIANLLGRLGYSPQEIGILMANEAFMTRPNYEDKKAPFIEFDNASRFLADTIFKTLTGNYSFNAFELKALQNLKFKIMEAANALNDEISLCRADSPNGAIDNSIGGINAQLINGINFPYITDGVIENGDYRISGLKFDNSLGSLREAFKNSPMPQVAAFRALGIELAADIMGQYHLGTSRTYRRIEETIASEMPNCKLSKELGNKVFRNFITYNLSKTSIFGDEKEKSMEDKRLFFLEVFPKQFDAWQKSHSELCKNNLFLKNLTYDKKSGKLIIASPKSFDEKTVNQIKRNAVDLFYNKETMNLAPSILQYCYYSNGLWFGPDSPSFYIMTTDFLINFPELIESLRFMENSIDNSDSRFLNQLYTNMAGTMPSRPISINKFTSTKMRTISGKLHVDSNYIRNKLGNTPKFLTLKAIQANILYIKESDTNKDVSVYSRVKNVPKFPAFNANSETIALAENEALYQEDDNTSSDTGNSKKGTVETPSNDSTDKFTKGVPSISAMEAAHIAKLEDDEDPPLDAIEIQGPERDPIEEAAAEAALAEYLRTLGEIPESIEDTIRKTTDEAREEINDKYPIDDSQNELDKPVCL